MKRKIFILLASVVCISLALSMNAFASNTDINIVPQDKPVYTNEDVAFSYSGVIEKLSAAGEISPLAVWVTYEKTVILQYQSDIMNPSLSYWPQSIEYTEPNPSGYGADAWGTLYIKSQSKVPGSVSFWNVKYKGTMGYFLL